MAVPAWAQDAIPTLRLETAADVDLVATALTLSGDPASMDDSRFPLAVRRAWEAAKPVEPKPPYSSRWLVARVTNETAAASWMLRMDTDPLYLPELVVMTDDRMIAHDRRDSAVSVGVETGSAMAVGQRFPLVIPPGETRLLALRVSAISYGSLAADVVSTEDYVTWAAGHQTVVMTALCLLMAVGAYNLLLGIGIRSSTYVWYALHAGSHLVYWATLYGLTADLAGFSDNDRIVYKLASTTTFLAAPFFVRGLLEPRLFAPFLDRMLIWCGWCGLGLMVPIIVLAPWPEVQRSWVRGPEFQFLLALIETPIFLLAGGLALRHRVAGAAWFLVGWGTYLAAILSLVLATYGIWQFSGNWLLAGLLSATWEAVMLSQALAGRIKAIHQAKLTGEARLAAQEDLLAAVSHELRTPLNAILGMARLLIREALPPRAQGRVQAIQRAGETLLGMVSNLLDRASLDAGQLQLSTAPAEPAAIMTGACTLMRDLAAAKGLEIVCTLDERLPQWIMVDAQRVRQVLINLIDNAVKYTDTGRIAVHVFQDQDRIHFSVSDSGKGIPAADRERIFSPFQRGKVAGAQGAGLGLAIARDLVKAMGGRLVVEDASTGGACFRFDIPLEPASPPLTVAPRALTVLLVDDIEINREVAALLLRGEGHTALPTGPEAAIDLLLAHPIDAVLLDVNMPGIDGPELARRIRSLPDQGKANVRILALSAGIQPTAQAQLAKLGVTEYLSKPLAPDTLRAALASGDTQAKPAPASL